MSNDFTTATNLSGVDVNTGNSLTNTQKYFNNFKAADFSVGPVNDVMVAFFETYTDNKITARNLASTVLYTAQVQQLDPLKVLDDFRQLPKGQLNTYLVAFLNSSRSPTSFLGVKTEVKTNTYVDRSIIL